MCDRVAAATKIQSLWRTYKKRQKPSWIEKQARFLEALVRNRAALCIQQWWQYF